MMDLQIPRLRIWWFVVNFWGAKTIFPYPTLDSNRMTHGSYHRNWTGCICDTARNVRYQRCKNMQRDLRARRLRLIYVAKHLASRIVSMQQSLRNSNTQSLILSKEEQELVDLSRRCENCGLKLQHETVRLQTKPRTSIVLAASKAARALWKKNSIEKIQRELERYRLTLELSLLSRLR